MKNDHPDAQPAFLQVVECSGNPPVKRPNRGRPGKYTLVYERAMKLKPGKWLRVVEVNPLTEKDKVWAVEAIRKGLAGRGVADMLRCYIDTAGNIIIANKGTEE